MDAEARRRDLVERLAIRDARVREALLAVPREAFLDDDEAAYVDAPQPIGSGQTISAPHMVALMAEWLDVQPHHRVLEVGGGSGYHAAVYARLAQEVVSVEVVPALAERARATLRRLGVRNVEVVLADGSLGYPPRAPYDRISVAAGAPRVPRALVDQLAPGGVLLVPVGGRASQWMLRVTREGEESLGEVMFVPLVGADGWPG